MDARHKAEVMCLHSKLSETIRSLIDREQRLIEMKDALTRARARTTVSVHEEDFLRTFSLLSLPCPIGIPEVVCLTAPATTAFMPPYFEERAIFAQARVEVPSSFAWVLRIFEGGGG